MVETLRSCATLILASVAGWLWWPKSEKEWRRFGFVVAYLLVFYVVMRYVFQMKDFKELTLTVSTLTVASLVKIELAGCLL